MTTLLTPTPTPSDALVQWRWLVPILLSLISMLGSSMVVYTNNDKTISNRLTTVETQQSSDSQRLERMENKLDRLIERSH